MIGFMTRQGLGLVLGFVEEKAAGSGDVVVTAGSRGIFLGSHRSLTTILRGLARTFSDMAGIPGIQRVLKAESGKLKAEMGRLGWADGGLGGAETGC
jgi:hypothetical protein